METHWHNTLVGLAVAPALRCGLVNTASQSTEAYGTAISKDLAKAIDRLQNRQGWLERCMQVMAMNMPKAVLWQKIRNLRQVLPVGT